jgi:phosphopantothenoylcysteine synthetase/decarboxylase
MSICNSERNRFASIWVIFCAYIVYSSSEWHALGFLCDNASIPMRLLLKYLGDFENKRGNNSSRGNHDDRLKRKVKGGEDEDEDDRGEDDEEDEDDDGEEEEEKLKNKDKDEEEINSDNSNR